MCEVDPKMLDQDPWICDLYDLVQQVVAKVALDLLLATFRQHPRSCDLYDLLPLKNSKLFFLREQVAQVAMHAFLLRLCVLCRWCIMPAPWLTHEQWRGNIGTACPHAWLKSVAGDSPHSCMQVLGQEMKYSLPILEAL